ncbi:sugar transferase [Qipengyuania sp. SS22]|uniref:sugar transferase n=1 Tax=Qipengyuania sp. SS22 TaxID=2979461 RepID=UPI0021E5BCA9|nr:sugar transferase [Qipengyuania sp. SS22]UYH56085.1 sugar transferase [Qipengyuania sp. SS22]
MSQQGVINSGFGVVVCSFISLAILRRLRFYPGVAVARSILPVVAIVFGVLVAIIAGFRFEYSNKVIGTCFAAILGTRFAITAVRSRAKGILYYLVPGGRIELLKELRGAPVLPLVSPTLDGLPESAIVADLSANLEPEWERFLAEAAISGCPVYHYKQVWEAETGKVRIEHLSENGFGALVPNFAYQKIKRGVDLFASLVAIPIVVPIVALCALAIKWDSRGPVFFRQRRLGFRGKEFLVLKLRTMIEGHAGDNRNLSITQSDDKRITRVGGFLRRTRLDELPQILNILRGEMSWIGPRPEAVSLSQWYEGEIPFYRYRHIVRPGITGWAQVNLGHVAEVEQVDEKLQYDFYYIKNLSYWLDILISLRTIGVMLSGFGSK